MKTLPRRTFLKGAGAVMGLPLLEAMLPRGTQAAEAAMKSPTRMAFVFFPNGAIMPAWKPKQTGTSYELSETLSPLSKFQNQMNVITGLAQDNGRAKGDGPGDHARCASTYLTGAHPVKTSGSDIKVGVSVDQVAAQAIGKLTKLPSLELGIERGRNAGNCDSGYSCAYSSNVSWKSPKTPMAKEVNPRLVFERLFGNQSKGEQDTRRRDFYRKSILDLVSQNAEKLKFQLGQTDRRKIDEYFTSVRELERRILKAEEETKRQRPDFKTPTGIPRDLTEHIRLMYDLMVLAFRTDTTRVSTFMLGNAGSNRSYRMVDVREGHHSLSHHQNKKAKTDQIKKIDKYLATQFAYFLDKLNSVKEGDRTLLENSMVVYGSGLGDANRHSHHDLPMVMAGQAGGTIKTGSHIALSRETPMNNLFLSMLDRVGAKVESIGDSSGRLNVIDV